MQQNPINPAKLKPFHLTAAQSRFLASNRHLKPVAPITFEYVIVLDVGSPDTPGLCDEFGNPYAYILTFDAKLQSIGHFFTH